MGSPRASPVPCRPFSISDAGEPSDAGLVVGDRRDDVLVELLLRPDRYPTRRLPLRRERHVDDDVPVLVGAVVAVLRDEEDAVQRAFVVLENSRGDHSLVTSCGW